MVPPTKTSMKQQAATVSSSSKSICGADSRYTFDAVKLSELRKSAPWKTEPTWFRSVDISPSAIMKMMMHCQSGVEKGIAKGGNPTEVMGLLLGRPDPQTPHTLVVTDVFALPIEGFETRVIADDEDVINHMIALGECLERTRREKFMGWYHSHPFDLGVNSHCFLSQTDISTQLQWQRAEDPHGNPFLAIVVDPLRTLAKNVPELKAFRVYPPEYNSTVANECPDGTVVKEEQARLEKWGSCWSRYYELTVDYFMSENARTVMNVLTQNFLWIRTLGSTPMLEAEARQRYPERVATIAEKIKVLDLASLPGSSGATVVVGAGIGSSGSSALQGRGMAYGGGSMSGVPATSTSTLIQAALKGDDDGGELGKACQEVVDLATEKIQGNIVQVAKRELFS